MRNYLLIAVGFTSLSAGIIGIFVPVLPTTPFILLAAGCFMKSSARLYRWITSHKVFGPYIDGYLKFHAVGRRTKIISIIILWIAMSCSIVFGVTALWLRLLLAGIAVGVTVHLALLKTLTFEMMEKAYVKERGYEEKTD